MTALLTLPGDELTPLRARLEIGDWTALAAPSAEGLLAMALLSDPSWAWRDAWAACLAELLRPWWPKAPKRYHVARTELGWQAPDERTPEEDQCLVAMAEYREGKRQRWWAGICPRYSHERALAVVRPSGEAAVAMGVLGRWLP